MSQPEYLFGSNIREAQRLTLQTNSQEKTLLKIFTLAGIGPGQNIVNFGNGEGSESLMLARRVGPKGKVLGIEIDPGRLNISKEWAMRAGAANISLIEGDVTKSLKQLKPQADVAWSNNVVGHLGKEGIFGMLENMKHAVKENGIIVIHNATGWILEGRPQKLTEQMNEIAEKHQLRHDETFTIEEHLPNIVHQAGVKISKIVTLRSHEYDGRVPNYVIENWLMRFMSPNYYDIITNALGGEDNAASFIEDFTKWMKSNNPDKHIHNESILIVGSK